MDDIILRTDITQPRQMEIFPNLVTMFFMRAATGKDAAFLWAKHDRVWTAISWQSAAHQVAALAASFKKMGLKPGDRIMLVSENRPEWCIADLAIMAAGCVTVPTYTTNTERDHQHILADSGANAIIISDAKLARIVMPAVLRSSVKNIISIDPLKIAQQGDVRIYEWANLVKGGTALLEACVAKAAKITRNDLACIIYTSGTGGAPRGVMQHHGAILHNVEGASAVISEDFGWNDEVFLSFLPLSHAYEHSAGQFFPIGLGAQIYYSQGLEKLMTNLEEVRPTIMVVVPRLFEVIRQRMLKGLEKQGKFANYLLARALSIGASSYAKGHVPLYNKPMNALLNRTLRPKISARFGGRMKALVSGGAPLNPDIGIFFHSLGLTLLQGYGQTEAAPIIACNRPRAGIKMESVGPPLPKTEVRIADDGEILVRGELVMKGYWNNPEETARILQNGWLHTGDIGHIDKRGRVVITDRKKDIIVNDKGDNVAPQRVEGILTLQPEILQAMVYGDNRPHLVGILVPDPEWMDEWAEAEGLPHDLSLLREHPRFRSALRDAVDRVNKGLATVEKVRNFDFADGPFTIDNEQMTPSMKIRRHVLKSVYADKIAGLYKA
jgi:long-chain acyl-CoA synthetase